MTLEYTTADGQAYQMIKDSDWQRRPDLVDPSRGETYSSFWNFYSDWLVFPRGEETQAMLFSIGCTRFFGGKVCPSEEIPGELAVFTIQWLLETEELPSPINDWYYFGVFTREGLRHRPDGRDDPDPQFGEQSCRTWQGVTERLRRRCLEAREEGKRTRIGFRSSSTNQVWTHTSEVLRPV